MLFENKINIRRTLLMILKDGTLKIKMKTKNNYALVNTDILHSDSKVQTTQFKDYLFIAYSKHD